MRALEDNLRSALQASPASRQDVFWTASRRQMSRASRPAHSQCSAIGQNCRCRLVFEFSYFLYSIFYLPSHIVRLLYYFIFTILVNTYLTAYAAHNVTHKYDKDQEAPRARDPKRLVAECKRRSWRRAISPRQATRRGCAGGCTARSCSRILPRARAIENVHRMEILLPFCEMGQTFTILIET